MADPSQEGPVARIQSVARAKAILDVLAAKGGGWVSLRDIAAGSGLVKTTAFNLVMALVEVRLVEHNPALGAYRLGFELMGYGRTVERRRDILGLLRPYLVRLCATTRETVNLALPCPTDVLDRRQPGGIPVAAHHVLCRHALLLSFDGLRARAARLRVRCDPPPDLSPPSLSRRSRRTRRPSPTRSKRSSRNAGGEASWRRWRRTKSTRLASARRSSTTRARPSRR